MKFQIITIGKKHDKNLEDFIQDFEKRIKANFDFEWSILKSEDDNNKEVQIKKESEKILEFLQKNNKNSFVILLDEKGKEKTTKEISNLFEEKMNEGIEKIIFIIGGAFGVSEDIFKKGDLVLGLSKLTLPHQLVRALLTEQIYRAISILKNGKYHHE
ncbi:MAG: 23S rRNA (pseudouridine(1915)-N(3))-methyltransferase RlmH [Candidatus Nomurabacteria bacterium]